MIIKITDFQSKIRVEFITEYYTEKLLSRLKKMYNTQQELVTELYTHDSFPSWNDLSPIA